MKSAAKKCGYGSLLVLITHFIEYVLKVTIKIIFHHSKTVCKIDKLLYWWLLGCGGGHVKSYFCGSSVRKNCNLVSKKSGNWLEFKIVTYCLFQPALQKPYLGVLTVDRVCEGLPSFPRSKQAQAKHSIQALLTDLNYSNHMAHTEVSKTRTNMKPDNFGQGQIRNLTILDKDKHDNWVIWTRINMKPHYFGQG